MNFSLTVMDSPELSLEWTIIGRVIAVFLKIPLDVDRGLKIDLKWIRLNIRKRSLG